MGGFDRYAKGNDISRWLPMHNAQRLCVDRKKGPPTIVKKASVSICGGIQPGILRLSMTEEKKSSGLLARLLLSSPPRKAKVWTDDVLPANLVSSLGSLYEKLLSLKSCDEAGGNMQSTIVNQSSAAKELFVAFFNRHGEEQVELEGEWASAWSKLEELPGRIALILHFVKFFSGETESENMVDQDTMRNAIEITEWFKNETKRVYAILSESPIDRFTRKLIETIERKGGRLTARQLQQSSKSFNSAEDAERALQYLCDAGAGSWESSPRGKPGRPTRYFVLSSGETSPNNETPSKPSQELGSVDEAPDSQTKTVLL